MNKQQAAEALAQKFHEIYERLAPEYGYETRKETSVPWTALPDNNKRLMIAVCSTLQSVIDAGEKPLSAQGMVDDYADMIRYLLPLAKGYVHAHPGIRSTECIIEDAEAMIAARPKGE